jgi:hypothetical protein
MSDDLVARLRHAWDERERQLDEDERVAQEALHEDAVRPGEWMTEHHDMDPQQPHTCHIAEDRAGHYWSVAHAVYIPNAEHVARHDPARVLAEVERGRRDIAAKRRILDDYDIVVSAIRRTDDVAGNQLLYARRDAARRGRGPDLALRLLVDLWPVLPDPGLDVLGAQIDPIRSTAYGSGKSRRLISRSTQPRE